MIDYDKVDKIQKALNLALNTDNANESQNAFRKARRLIQKNNLNIDTIFNKNHQNKTILLSKPNKSKQKFKYLNTFNLKTIIDKLFKIHYDQRVVLQIIPDESVVNGRGVESILNTFHSMYESFFDRIWNDNFKLIYKSRDYVSYRIVYKKDSIIFLLVIPQLYLDNVKNSISNTWSKCAIIENDYNEIFNPKLTACAYLELKDHFFKATLSDRTEDTPVPSLMAAGRNLLDDDKAILDVTFIPVSKRWQRQARDAIEKSKSGHEVKRRPTNLTDFGFLIGDFISDGIIEKFLDVLDIFMGGESKKQEKLNREDRPSYQTITNQKHTFNGFDTVIRIASESVDKQRAHMTLKAIGTSFKDLSLDNEFEIREVHTSESFVNRLQKNKTPLFRINGNILSTPECAQILKMPTQQILIDYPEVEKIENMEVEADKRLIDSGVFLGDITVKRKTKPVHLPTKKWDDFCRTMVIMGGQGQGKTKGFLSNLLIESYLNGFGGLTIDAAKKEISTEIKHAVKMGIVREEDFIHIDASKTKISLDWKEALLDKKYGLSRLASTAIDFFQIEKDTTGQTGRFLRALIMCMKSARMIELIELMEDVDYLKTASTKLSGLNRKTIEQYISVSPDRRRQISAPIYNRLDQIIGDEYLSECLESGTEIDLVDITSSKKIYVFDFSDNDLLPSQQDILINMLFTKIDLAMKLREKIHGREAEFPFVIACDEPAKYLKSSRIWEALTVQGRKWRFVFAWAFHYFDQLPKGFQTAIKASLPHYFFYPTTKDQWKFFTEEILPFTLENAMKLKAFHAINVIYTQDGYLKPFIAKMAAPPSVRFKKEN